MQAASCKCGEKQTFGSDFPPCNACEKCGTAPGYKASGATPHRNKKRFDQRTGEPFMFCFACGNKSPFTEKEA